MSFSQEVKEEILNKYTKATHCQKAQLAALLIFDAKNVKKDSEKDGFIYNFTSGRKTWSHPASTRAWLWLNQAKATAQKR